MYFGSSVTAEGPGSGSQRDQPVVEMKENEEIYDILVLGAGLAGLGAAKELVANGKSVCVLEAQERPGGRVQTVRMTPCDTSSGSEEILVESGAQWIHGKENSLYKIAEENNLISPDLGEEACGKFIRDDGKVLDDFLVKRIDFKIGEILEECEKFVEVPLEKDISIREYLEKKFQGFLNENPDIDPVEAGQCLDWHIRFQIIDNSCRDLRDVGVNDWGRYSFNGESCQAHINVRKGFEEVLKVIVDKVGNGKIFCNHEVTKVNWGGSLTSVQCRNGRTFEAKFVIVTFPIGILQKDQELFHPRIPPEFQSEIQRMGYGTIDKIYLRFEDPFWDKQFKGIQFVWTNYKDSELIPKWMRSMTGFDLLNEKTLIGWIGGEGALEMEKLTDQEIVSDCLRVLSVLLKKTLPQPSHFHCTRWHSNQFIRGSYCFNGLSDKDSPKVSLQSPIHCLNSAGDHPLFLAGEACHPSYFSTAHGAFESGIEQAKKVLELLS